MRGARHIPVVVTSVAATVCAVGWYLSASSSHAEDFGSCTRDGSRVTVTITHAPGQGFALTSEPREGRGTTLSYQPFAIDGDSTMAGVREEFTFLSPPGDLFYPDGREIECNDVSGE